MRAYNRVVMKLAVFAFLSRPAVPWRSTSKSHHRRPGRRSAQQKTAARMLSEEITRRTQLRLNTLVTMPAEGPVIFLRTGAQPGPEGFTLTTSHETSGHRNRQGSTTACHLRAGYLLRSSGWAAAAGTGSRSRFTKQADNADSRPPARLPSQEQYLRCVVGAHVEQYIRDLRYSAPTPLS